MICTTLEQSKKLVELGIDSNTADLWYGEVYEGHVEMNGRYVVSEEPYYTISFTKPSEDNYSQNQIKDIPAWSLAALLELLSYPQLSKDKLGSGKTGWMVSAYPDDCRYDSCWHDNPVDACVEMIVKLKAMKGK